MKNDSERLNKRAGILFSGFGGQGLRGAHEVQFFINLALFVGFISPSNDGRQTDVALGVMYDIHST